MTMNIAKSHSPATPGWCECSLREPACPSSSHGLQHLAGLRVVLGLDEPAVLVSEDVVL
eukprot:CAMPEP_0204532122 /NCGR_PEP_ID=MMETSP0661-20131031/11555_1 /ASSEMBLY_ACC=CAM_ASM_000606 /TAXON_ID=109239 /ORGANISM="Alexandrium margalefi, Strain AMGDE01CS-322" /LENGTH=58 /DNA_ID=CAMNT_0051538341 /DNA_START=149 /DNA_END=321 /DNA_ORIENTATION=+